jgi:peroxiredoxin
MRLRPLRERSFLKLVSLDSIDGSTANLAEVFAAKPTILIFYRGGWCPFCNRQLAGLADSELDFRRLGYQIIAVSPDAVPALDKTAATKHLHFRLLSDRQQKISAAYQVAYRIPASDEPDYRANGISLPQIPGKRDFWLTNPTAFVIGRDGLIKFVYTNSDPSVTVSKAGLLEAARAAVAGF